MTFLYSHMHASCEIFFLQLYLYAQYNGKNERIVLDDAPSTSMPDDIDCSKLGKREFILFNIFCWIFPILLYLLMWFLVMSCRPRIRHVFGPPISKSSINQNYAALVLTGIVFSIYVIVCDAFAVRYSFEKDIGLKLLDEYEEKEYIHTFSQTTVIAILVIDSVSLLVSLLNIIFLFCNSLQCNCWKNCCGDCLMHYIRLFYCFCCFKWIKVTKRQDDVYDYELLHPARNDINNISAKTKIHKENKAWLLLVSFLAPLVCIGTHASFIVMAWTSDPSDASSMTVIFTLSFFYYFFGFRQLYIILSSCPCLKCNTEENNTTDNNINISHTSTVSNDDNNSGTLTANNDNNNSCKSKISNCFKSCESAVSKWCESEITEASTELHEYHENLNDFNYIVFFIEIIFGIVLAGIQAFVVVTFFLIPAPFNAAPLNILNILHLALIVGSGLLAYKVLTFHAPTEDIIVEKFVDAYNAPPTNIENGNAHETNKDLLGERVGTILGHALRKIVQNSQQGQPGTMAGTD